MKTSLGMLYFAALWLVATPFARAQTPPATASASVSVPSPAVPDFQIEIQPTAEQGPTFSVRNMSDKAIAAYVFEFSYSATRRRLGGTVWDAALQRKPVIEPGATLTNHLSHAVDQPLPDKVEVVAGAFADGDTFGQTKWVQILLQDRAMRLAQYEQTVAFLQKGLDAHWTYEQYLAALDQPPKLEVATELRQVLEINTGVQRHPENLQEFIESTVDRYNRYARKIRQLQAPAAPPQSQPPAQQ